MGINREFLSEYFSNDGKRKSIVSKDKYHYIVDMYERDTLVWTELINKNESSLPEEQAEDLAEEWVLYEISKP
jgi:hypothetical protein